MGAIDRARLSKLAAKLAIGLWWLCLTLLLASRMALSLDAPDFGARVLSPSQHWPAVDHPLLVALMSQSGLPYEHGTEPVLDGVRLEPLADEPGWWYGTVRASDLVGEQPLELRVDGYGRSLPNIELNFPKLRAEPTAMPARLFRQPPRPSRSRNNILESESPGFRWDDTGSACMADWQLIVDGGAPQRFVDVSFAIWAVSDGAVLPGLEIELVPGPEQPALRSFKVQTDAQGLARWSSDLQGAERWEVHAACPDGQVGRRTLIIVPTWSGIRIERSATVERAGAPVRVRAHHQRASGSWVLALSCGGHWLGIETLPVARGGRLLELQSLRWPEVVRPMLCELHAAPSIWFLKDASRVVVLVAAAGQEGDAWSALSAAASVSGNPVWRQWTRRWSAAEIAQLSSLQLATLELLRSDSFEPPLLVDTTDEWAAIHNEANNKLRLWIDRLLILQGLSLVGLGLPWLVLRTMRTRRRMLESLELDELDQGGGDNPGELGSLLMPLSLIAYAIFTVVTLIAAWRTLLYAMGG